VAVDVNEITGFVLGCTNGQWLRDMKKTIELRLEQLGEPTANAPSAPLTWPSKPDPVRASEPGGVVMTEEQLSELKERIRREYREETANASVDARIDAVQIEVLETVAVPGITIERGPGPAPDEPVVRGGGSD